MSERNKATKKNRPASYHLRTVVAVIMTLIMLFPLYWMVNTALKTESEVLTIVPSFWPKTIRWENFSDAWNAQNFPRLIFNTFYVTAWMMFFDLIVCILAGYGFARGRFPFKNALFLLVLSAMMIPAQVVFIPVYVLIANLGWVNTFAGMILPGVVSAHRIFMLRNNFMSVDQSYLDAGRVDGLGILGTIRHILVPMCSSAVVTTCLTAFINGWNNYFWPKILAKDDAHRLIAVGINRLKAQFSEVGDLSVNGGGFYNTVMAGVLISIIPVIIVFILSQKHILKGFAKNAMK